MNAKAKENLSIKAKSRWEDCKIIAPLLEMSKFQVNNNYNKIKHLIQKIKDGEYEAVKEAVRLINETPTVRIHRTVTKGNDQVLTTSDELRIAMWFIKKIGSPDRALEVMKIACQADKKLEQQ